MLEHTQWPVGAQVKLGAALVKFLIETATWVHNEDSGGVSAARKGEGGRAEGELPRAAFVHEVVKRKHKQQQGTLSLAPEIYAKVGGEGRVLVSCGREGGAAAQEKKAGGGGGRGGDGRWWLAHGVFAFIDVLTDTVTTADAVYLRTNERTDG